MSRIRKTNKNMASVILGTLAFFVCVSGLAFASGGGAEHGGGHGSGQLADLMYRGINFSLLVIILFVVVRRTSIKDFFENRREEIKHKFEELNKKKEQAERRYHELKKRLEEFEASKQEIIEQYRAEGLAEKEKIIAEARQRADQILEQAEMTIQREIMAAGESLKQEILDSAAKRAREIIDREMTDRDQDHLVDEFIKSVEKLH